MTFQQQPASVESLECRRIQLMLERLPADSATSDADAMMTIQAHTATCTPCATFLKQDVLLDESLRALPRLSVAPGFSQAVMQRIDRLPNHHPVLQHPGWRSIAASVALVFAAGFLTLNLWGPQLAKRPQANQQLASALRSDTVMDAAVYSGNDESNSLTENLADVVGF